MRLIDASLKPLMTGYLEGLEGAYRAYVGACVEPRGDARGGVEPALAGAAARLSCSGQGEVHGAGLIALARVDPKRRCAMRADRLFEDEAIVKAHVAAQPALMAIPAAERQAAHASH